MLPRTNALPGDVLQCPPVPARPGCVLRACPVCVSCVSCVPTFCPGVFPLRRGSHWASNFHGHMLPSPSFRPLFCTAHSEVKVAVIVGFSEDRMMDFPELYPYHIVPAHPHRFSHVERRVHGQLVTQKSVTSFGSSRSAPIIPPMPNSAGRPPQNFSLCMRASFQLSWRRIEPKRSASGQCHPMRALNHGALSQPPRLLSCSPR